MKGVCRGGGDGGDGVMFYVFKYDKTKNSVYTIRLEYPHVQTYTLCVCE